MDIAEVPLGQWGLMICFVLLLGTSLLGLKLREAKPGLIIFVVVSLYLVLVVLYGVDFWATEISPR